MWLGYFSLSLYMITSRLSKAKISTLPVLHTSALNVHMWGFWHIGVGKKEPNALFLPLCHVSLTYILVPCRKLDTLLHIAVPIRLNMQFKQSTLIKCHLMLTHSAAANQNKT